MSRFLTCSRACALGFRPRLLNISICTVVVMAAGASSASAVTLTVRSGNGPGPLDTAVQVVADSVASTAEPRGANIAPPNVGYANPPIGTSKFVSVSASNAGGAFARFETTFTLPAGAVGQSMSVAVHADNRADVLLNNIALGGQPAGCPASNFRDPPEVFTAPSSSAFLPGANTLAFLVYNCGGPTALDFEATITYRLASPEPAGLDHFKCYAVQRQSTRSRLVTLHDQFATKRTRVLEARQLCNPVRKTVAGAVTPIRNPRAHLVCRRTADIPFGTPVRAVRLRNQFGIVDTRTTRAQTLCIPSLKRIVRKASRPIAPSGSNPERVLDHFRCYGVEPRPKSMGVGLTDQFGTKSAKVIDLVQLCNPVRKTYRGKHAKVKRSAAHLACYRISEGSTVTRRSVLVRNQLGIGRLRTGLAQTLCLPTFKVVLRPRPNPTPRPIAPLPYTAKLTALACADGMERLVHTVRGTTEPARPDGLATLVLSGPGGATSAPQTARIAEDGTFTAQTTTPTTPGVYRWIASVKDLDEVEASASTDVTVSDRPPRCTPAYALPPNTRDSSSRREDDGLYPRPAPADLQAGLHR